MRIVSLVPSLTLTVSDLGLRNRIVGCTSFCVLPKGIYKEAQICGGTKNPDLELIRALHPTHILLNTEENRASDINACKQIAPTLVTHPRTAADNITLLENVGRFLSVEKESQKWTRIFQKHLDTIATFRHKGVLFANSLRPAQTCLYFIWREPYMVVGDNTYIHSLLCLMGLQNLAVGKSEYPTLSLEEINALNPDILLFSSEPYAFKRRHAEELTAQLDPVLANKVKTFKIDGQLMSWWGTLSAETLALIVEGCESPIVWPTRSEIGHKLLTSFQKLH